jgi:hypothetical protein
MLMFLTPNENSSYVCSAKNVSPSGDKYFGNVLFGVLGSRDGKILFFSVSDTHEAYWNRG